MRKRIGVLLATLVMLLVCAMPAFAANGKPSVELSYFVFWKNSVGGGEPTLYFRNNTNKAVKYYDWYITLYNRVGDPVKDEITNSSTIKLRVIGPSNPETPITTDTTGLNKQTTKYFPRKYKNTGKSLAYNGGIRSVYIDEYGNYFIFGDPVGESYFDGGKDETCIFLTPDEVQNRTFEQKVDFGVCWYNSVCEYVRLQKVVVTYMDGTTETISGSKAEANRLNTELTNRWFALDETSYYAVYDYNEYKELNPDLAAIYGDNRYLYFQHFIASGMKEGRQGAKSFNLAAYKANNPDLVAQFGDDNVKYYEHYQSSGYSEGRKAT